MAKKVESIFNSPMASIDAPMYVDFSQGTPNASAKLDDFFDIIHPEHDDDFGTNDELASPLDFVESNNIVSTPSSDGEFLKSLNTIEMTPIKVIKNTNTTCVLDETTVGTVFDNVNNILASISKNKKMLHSNLDKSLQNDHVNPIKSSKKIRISKSLHNTITETDENLDDKIKIAKKTRKSIATSLTIDNTQIPLGSKVKVNLTADDEFNIGEMKKIIYKPIRMGTRVTRSMKMNNSQINNCETNQVDELSNKVQNVSLDEDEDDDDDDVDNNDTLISQDGADSQADTMNSIEAKKDCQSLKLEDKKITIDNVINSVSRDVISSISTTGIQQLLAQGIPLDMPSMNESRDTFTKILETAKEIKTLVKTKNDKPDNATTDYQNVDNIEKFEVHQMNYDEKKPIKTRSGGVKSTVLATTHARRRSSIMPIRSTTNKYISVAEAIKKFHRATPDRYHTKKPVSKEIQKIMKYEPKSTVPVSPALRSKSRTRKNHVLSQAEREELELQEIKKHKLQPNPLRKSILAAAKPLKEVAKKPPTMPKPFHLTKVNQKPPTTTTKFNNDKPSTSTDHIYQSKKTVLPKKNIVPTIVSANNGLAVTQTQILHFGIPTNPNRKTLTTTTATSTATTTDRHDNKKKIIHPLSSAFDERNKQFLEKKEQKIKNLQIKEAEKLKSEFHARPVPSIIKKSIKKTDNNHDDKLNDNNNHHSVTKSAPFSFEQRDKSALKKKEELRKKLEKEECKKRVFHANPVPHFKPVNVRTISKESLHKDDKIQQRNNNTIKKIEKSKSYDNLGVKLNISSRVRATSTDRLNRGVLSDKSKQISRGNSRDNLKPISRGNSRDNLKPISRANSHKNINDQENKAPNNQIGNNMPALKQKLQPFELHSDKRAKLRREFDENIRQKIEYDEMKKKREQAEKLAREQLEINEMRKKAEIKARPMPVFKPPVHIKSTKALTAPESPAWSRRLQPK
ncbi:MATH and LRR domain-containing protein PFE0570w-like [Aphidius gifuensis]|uniref:MATH and LRR domain-containing protein PFE0570w-like n=1 Tax=Aphidius gifuensis TaxID=684658 RepID=UPI001CDD0FF6|nr:MATH and LRR domain-containing protein PFE0570w-like [Aphidius gifuensis]